MIHKISSAIAKEDMVLLVYYLDGTVVEYDVEQLLGQFPQLEALKDVELFSQVQVDTAGYGISWSDDLDLDAETIWEDGNVIGHLEVSLENHIATIYAEARAERGLTQKDLAEKTGIYQAEISKIERGIGNPSVKTLKRLADGLDMQLQINLAK